MTTNCGYAARGKQSSVAAAVHRALNPAGVTLMALIASLGAGTAIAQEQPAAESSDSIQEVTVAGSRIVRADGYEAPTPVSVLGMEDLNKMATTNVADAVNRLPAFAGSVTTRNVSTNVSSGTAGVNNLNLRGLGANRTLVLLDGKRVVGSSLSGTDNNGGAVDVNAMPNGLIRRVEVVTGGASAVYGSDALAGVVNFVLDKEFTGVKGSFDAGTTSYGDGEDYKVSLTAGTPFAGGRGHLLFSGEYAKDEGILHTDRPWADQSYQLINNPSYTATNGQPKLIKVFNAGVSNATPGGLIVSCPVVPGGAQSMTCPLRGTQFVAGGTPIGFEFGPIISGSIMSGGDWERSRIDQIPGLSLPLTRDNAYGRGSFELTDNATAFVELQWSKTKSFNEAVVPNFDLADITIQSGNPFIPASVQAQMTAQGIGSFLMGTVNGDMSFLQGNNERELRRYTAGIEGDVDLVGTNWKWDGYYTRGTQDIAAMTPGDRLNANYQRAVNAVVDTNGRIVCGVNADADPANDDPACVPYNPMGLGVNSQEALAYVTGTGWSQTKLQQDVVALSANGEPFSTWAGKVSLAFGAEHRRESVEGVASALDEANSFFAGNFHASRGKYDVTEGFLETVVPLAKALPFAESLDLNGAVRYTDYSTSGEVTTWKLGATWAPIDDVRFRLTRSRDIRAPSLGELYNAGQSGTGNVLDPVTGVTSTIISRTTGNVNLKPEEADTTGIGVVFTPTFLHGFAASIDYYKIDIAGAIASLGTQLNVDRCFQGVTQLCAFITRDANGNIVSVNNQPANILSQKASGLDVEASYNFPLLNGEMALRAMGTYVDSLETVDTTSVIDGVGVNSDSMGTGSGNALFSPKFRYLLSATYNLEPVSVTLTGRGVSSGKYNNAFIECESGCPAATTAHPTIDDNHIAGATYMDLALNYKLPQNSGEVYFVAENLLDEDPALVAGSLSSGFYQGQANTRFYDRLGRMYRAGVRFKF